ncbi:MAG: hypothetical protein ACI4KA_04810 [Oscillospiraceae bacterium]
MQNRGIREEKTPAYNPYLPSREYIPDGVNAVYLTFGGEGKSFALE